MLPTYGRVLSTSNYDIFNRLPGNRPINQENVRRLKKDIAEHGLHTPIEVNEELAVADGQHRLQACRELGIPVEYIFKKGASIETARALNTTQRPWRATDFIGSYAETGNKNYVRIQQFMEETGLAFRIALKALCPNVVGAEQLAKEGKLIITEKDVAAGKKVFEFWRKFDCLSRDADQIRNIYLVLLFLMDSPEVDLKRLEKSLLKHGVNPFHGMDGGVREINATYNLGAPRAKKLDFMHIYEAYKDRRRHNRS